jgi:tetratricopeptide (TPR) repeat protein
VAAAQRATSTFAYEEAARHYEEALAAGADANRDELLLSLGRAHDYAGRRDRARSAFADAAQVARERGDPSLLARAALGYGGLAVVIAAPDAAVIALLEEALAALPPTERATVARVHARLAVELAYADPERAAELSGRAVDAADSAALPAALNARRVALWAPAHADERLAVSTAMIEASSAAGDHENALQGRNWRVVDLMELGRVAEAMSEIDAYDSLARALGPPHYRWYAPLWRTCLALLTGRWHDTAALAEEALTIGRQADDPNAPFLVRLQGLHALVLQRRFADVERSWVAEKAADPHAGVAWKAGLALLDAELGDVESARGLLAELRATVPMNANWHAACLLAEAAARVGDRDAAATLYDLLTPHARLFPVVARGVACYGSAEYFTGRLAATLGRWDEAQARLHRAVAENDRVGASPSAALALAALGDVLAAQGAYGDARHALTSAAARARATYMPALEARAERALSACPVG